jgi:hypothetical protein
MWVHLLVYEYPHICRMNTTTDVIKTKIENPLIFSQIINER